MEKSLSPDKTEELKKVIRKLEKMAKELRENNYFADKEKVYS